MTAQTFVLVDGVTHPDHDIHVKTQAVLACVQQIYADESWTAQVLAAAVLAQHQLNTGEDPSAALATLTDGLERRLVPPGSWP